MFYFSHSLIDLIDSKRHYACESTCLRQGTAERKVNTAIKWPSVANNPPSCDHFRCHGTGDLIWKIVAKLASREN